ncbi:hypothetical protein [Myxococcus xanthus]|nr:hypothetical protein [Myxococcus xanthus]
MTCLRDADIRQPLAQLAAGAYPGAQVLHEVGLERGQALVPSWWGVVLARAEGGGLVLEDVRPALDNPSPSPGATVRLLWRPEMLDLLETVGAARGVRSASKGRLLARLIKVLPPADLRARVRQVVAARGDWRLT